MPPTALQLSAILTSLWWFHSNPIQGSAKDSSGRPVHRLQVGQGRERRTGTDMQPNKGRAEENNETCKHLTPENIDPKVSAENYANRAGFPVRGELMIKVKSTFLEVLISFWPPIATNTVTSRNTLLGVFDVMASVRQVTINCCSTIHHLIKIWNTWSTTSWAGIGSRRVMGIAGSKHAPPPLFVSNGETVKSASHLSDKL